MTYYVVIRWSRLISILAGLLVFTASYGVMTAFRMPYRQDLAWAHLALVFVGVLLIFAPILMIQLNISPADDVPARDAWAPWSRVMAMGDGLVLLGAALFVILIGAAALDRLRAV